MTVQVIDGSETLDVENQHFQIGLREGCLIVVFTDYVDTANFSEVVDSLIDELGEHLSGRIILDMRHINTLQSVAIGALVGLHKHIHDVGGKMRVCHVQEMVASVLSITQIDTILDIKENEQVALRDWDTPRQHKPKTENGEKARQNGNNKERGTAVSKDEPSAAIQRNVKQGKKRSADRFISRTPGRRLPNREKNNQDEADSDSDANLQLASTVKDEQSEQEQSRPKSSSTKLRPKKTDHAMESSDGVLATFANVVMFFALSKWGLGLVVVVVLYFGGSYLFGGPYVSVTKGTRVAQGVLDTTLENIQSDASAAEWDAFRSKTESSITPLVLKLSQMGKRRTNPHNILLDTLKMAPGLVDEMRGQLRVSEEGPIRAKYKSNLKTIKAMQN